VAEDLPDAARDIYLSEAPVNAAPDPLPPVINPEDPVPPVQPVTVSEISEKPPEAPAVHAPSVAGDLEVRYLAALERAAAGSQGKEAGAWSEEIQRVKSQAPLPPPDETNPAELQRLQSIYRREVEKGRPHTGADS
jgi:hypothetical protein